jgi:hypothetical protein
MRITENPIDASKVNFHFDEKRMIKDLISGKNIILNGAINQALYQQLLPILSNNSHVYINGIRTEVKGKLTIVMPVAANTFLPASKIITKNFSIYDYEPSVSEITKTIERFYQLARRLPHKGHGRPSLPQVNYQQLKSMTKAIEDFKLHTHNPIKGLFLYDYPKNSFDYHYLNVLGKYLFRPLDETPARSEKLKSYFETLDIANAQDLQKHVWSVLNCFNGAELNKLFASQPIELLVNDQLELSSVFVKQLWEYIQNSYMTIVATPKQKKSHVEKRLLQLDTLLANPDKHLIILKGGPGVGKSFAVRQLKTKMDFNLYEGTDVQTIKAWLRNPGHLRSILLLDEGNMAKPGTWDFLKGLAQQQKLIYFDGEWYPLTSNHKIIVTSNEEVYSERYHHAFFQHYGETILFKIPEDNYLENEILSKILFPMNLQQHAVSLIAAYNLIQEHNPLFVYSTRDLENLARGFITMASQPERLLNACVAEFAGTIDHTDTRNKFIH